MPLAFASPALTLTLLTGALSQGAVPSRAPPDTVTVERSLPAAALAFLPTARPLLPRGFVSISTGYVSPFRAAAAGSEGGPTATGTGNQSYQGEVAWGISGRVSLHVGVEVNDDPTYAPVRGQRREKSLVTGALASRTRLWASDRLALGLQATAQVVWQGSAPGLFNLGSERDERVFPAWALAVPLTWTPADRASLTLAPSIARLPSSLMDAPYYGTMVRVGAGGTLGFGRDWTIGGEIELPMGPGDNVIDEAGRFDRRPTWRARLSWRATERVHLDGHLTNAAGVTPVTRHLTLPSDPRVLYGVGIHYTPSVPERRPRAAARGRIETAVLSSGAWAVHVHQALGHRFQIELLATRLEGVDAPAVMQADLGTSWEYRIGATLGLADEAEGDALTWRHRVSVGRDWDDQAGYLLAEVVAERRLDERFVLVANPLAIHSGGRSPVSVGVGLRAGVGALTVLPEWRGSFTGERPVWALGVGVPGVLAGWPGLDARAWLGNASGPRGLGRVLADPAGARLGVGLGMAF